MGYDYWITYNKGRDNIHMARNRMKQQADQHCFEHTFQVGDMVFLRLKPYKQSSMKLKGSHKMDTKLYGTYKVLQDIGSIYYKLELPPSSCVHLVSHVSFIKNFIGTNIRAQTVLPELDNEGYIILELEAILNRHTHQLRSQSITEVSIQ